VQAQLSLLDQAVVNTPAAVTASTEAEPTERPYQGRHPWALLLRHVFAVDVTRCAHCRAPMRLLQVCTTPHAIARAIARAGRGPQPPPRTARPSRSLPLQGLLQFGSSASPGHAPTADPLDDHGAQPVLSCVRAHCWAA
jgi:hypothetical protein